jgi:hypothetical protein
LSELAVTFFMKSFTKSRWLDVSVTCGTLLTVIVCSAAAVPVTRSAESAVSGAITVWSTEEMVADAPVPEVVTTQTPTVR